MKELLYKFAAINGDQFNVPKKSLTNDTFATVLQIVFGLTGGIAAVMIMVAAFRYVTSQGNPQETARAKDTILYALIGLGISVAAFSIVAFVARKV